MKRKVKINKLPKGYMQEGGSVNKTLQPVPREEANLEAEKGEVALLKQGGEPMTYNIGGKRHSQGGTPLNLEPGSRIFSDTKKMKIKDKNILAQFGATKPATPAKLAKKYNVNDYQASLANPFADDIEKNTARMMINKNEEKLDDLFFVQEAKKGFPQGVPGEQMNQEGMMMAKYGAQLPKAQGGIMAPGYVPTTNFARLGDISRNGDPSNAVVRGYNSALDGEPAPAPMPAPEPPATQVPSQGLFQSGYNTRVNPFTQYSTPDNPIIYTAPVLEVMDYPDDTGNIPVMYDANFGNPNSEAPVSTETTPSSAPSTGSNSGSKPANPRMMGSKRLYEGSKELTPTKKSNRFSYDPELFDAAWSELIPGFSELDEAAGQSATYDYMLANDPDRLREMWTEWGNTNKGKKIPALREKYPDGIIDGASLTEEDLIALKEAYVDGIYGDRQMYPNEKPVELPAKEPKVKESTEMEIPELKEAEDFDTKYFEQDLNNERTALRNRMSERLRLPWRGRLAARTMDPVYQSDVQQQQNILAGLNTASEAVSTFGSNPGAVMSNIARMSGISGNQSNQIAAALQRENTGIANQAEQFNAQQQAAADVRNLANAQDLYDNTIKAQEVFDEKMRNYNILQNELRNISETNKSRIEAFNKLNPEFRINTGEGPQYGNFEFASDVARAKYQGTENQKTAAEKAEADYLSAKKSINELQGITPEDRSELLKELEKRYLGLSAPKKGASSVPQSVMDVYSSLGMSNPLMASLMMSDPRAYYAQRQARSGRSNQGAYGYYKQGGKKY